MALSRPLNAAMTPVALAADGTGQGFSRSYRRRFSRESGPALTADFTAGALPAGWAFARASNATRVGPSGLVELAPHNWLGANSEDITGAGWSVSNATGTTATRLAYVSPAAAPSTFAGTPSIAYVAFLRFNVKYVSGSPWLWIYFNGYSGGSCWMNVQTGAAGAREANAVASLVADGVGGFDVTMTKTSPSTSSGIGFNIAAGDGSTSAPAGSGAMELKKLSFVGAANHPYYPVTGSNPYYGPRFDHDPVTRAPLGLLIEAQATNLLVWSADFNNALWTALGTASRSSPGGRTNPDGTLSVVQLNLPAGGDMCRQLVSGVSAGTSYTVSVWARKAASGGASTMRITTNNTSAWSTGFSKSFALTTDWQRLSVTGQITSGTAMYVIVGAVDAANGNDDGCIGNVELWGAQLEQGGAATSYIPTGSTALTRSGDTCRMATGPWFNPVAGTVLAEFQSPAPGSGRFAWCLVNAGRTGLQPSVRANQNVAAGAVSFTPNAAAPGVVKAALAMANNDWAYVCSNDTAFTWGSTAQTMQADLALLCLGEDGSGGGQLNGWVRRIGCYGSRLPNATLRSLAT